MKNLYQGDRGILVSYMQLALKRAGYTLLVDGIFGTNTCQALADFLQTDRICVVDRSALGKIAAVSERICDRRGGEPDSF